MGYAINVIKEYMNLVFPECSDLVLKLKLGKRMNKNLLWVVQEKIGIQHSKDISQFKEACNKMGIFLGNIGLSLLDC